MDNKEQFGSQNIFVLLFIYSYRNLRIYSNIILYFIKNFVFHSIIRVYL